MLLAYCRLLDIASLRILGFFSRYGRVFVIERAGAAFRSESKSIQASSSYAISTPCGVSISFS